MKIVNREEFLKMENVVFSKYELAVVSEPEIMHGSNQSNDYVRSTLFGDFDWNDGGERIDTLVEMESNHKVSVKMSIEETSRDGFFDDDQLFLIYEKEDLKLVADYLNKIIKGM
jgi:hypothetical protein